MKHLALALLAVTCLGCYPATPTPAAQNREAWALERAQMWVALFEQNGDLPIQPQAVRKYKADPGTILILGRWSDGDLAWCVVDTPVGCDCLRKSTEPTCMDYDLGYNIKRDCRTPRERGLLADGTEVWDCRPTW